MARRQGYGGMGGRPYFNNTGPVNPWQVGNAPGGNNQGNAFNSGNAPSNLLSHLSEPQAQLALALTKLLQPQQQVPSLLTMNTVNPLQGSGGYGPNHNYQPRGRGDMNRRPRQDMKRNEPFNKMNSRINRDTDFNRRRGNSNKNERKIQQHRTTVVSKPSKSSSAKVSPKPLGKAKETKPVTVEEKDESSPSADTTETSVKESDEKSEETESKDKKRDWKEEKTNDESDEKEETKEEASEDTETAEKEKTEDESESVPEKKTGTDRYDGIPRELLHCHICQKKMWDGESFEKHMNGRAHQQMVEKVEESYRIKADMMRQAIRLAEEKNNIEMDRMKRLGKKTKTQQLSRCAMCDLEFYGQLFVHRKSPVHQKLKHFLHPRCSYCNKEFPTRMEWENHRHTPEHLRKKIDSEDKKKPRQADDGLILEEECFIVIDSTESDEVEEPNALIDLTDDVSDMQVPTYKPNRAVGLSLISPATGFFCKPCSRFFMTEKSSKQHAKSKLHYDAFINVLNEKMAEHEAKKRKSVQEDDEGNWKRRKTAKEDDKMDETLPEDEALPEDETLPEDEIQGEDGIAAEDDGNDDANNAEDKNVGDELYDPAETFTTTDPNDICLDSIKVEVINDTVWDEVDDKIDEILDAPKEAEEIPIKVEPVKLEPAKPSPKTSGLPRRTTRAKK